MTKCSGCKSNVLVTQKRITCCNVSCHRIYHNECVDYTEVVSRSSWICPVCIMNRKKGDNTNTPVTTQYRIQKDTITPNSTPPTEISNYDPIIAEIRSLRADMNVKFEEQQSSLNDFNVTLTNMRQDIKELGTKFSLMRTELDEVINSLKFLSDFHDEQVKLNDENSSKITKLLAENVKLQSEVSDITTKITVLEQYSRDSNLEIQCVPEHKSENLISIIRQIAKTVSYELSDDVIMNFHRVAKLTNETNRPRNIVVKLSSPRIRDGFLAAVKVFNKKNAEDKLNTSHLGLAGKKQPIFVQEHLSPTNKKLHAATRITAKQKNYQFVWVRNGHIFIRKDIKSPPKLIKDLGSLSSL
ncbi:unnamed protein product [Parnassius mnemosyne]|uniref:PHD-type domain-containing protein n=1 Tax=Parnassius mnemosyne TaxID=213953 RepID=A0AAV1KE61_9NEOP